MGTLKLKSEVDTILIISVCNIQLEAEECHDIDECGKEYATPGFPDFSDQSFCTIEIGSIDADKCVEIDFTSFDVGSPIVGGEERERELEVCP